MEHEKLMSFIARNQSISENAEIKEWISLHEDNKEEYIRYKNLWALTQTGNEMSVEQINQGFLSVKKLSKNNNSSTIFWGIMKHVAIVIMALLGGYSLSFIKFSGSESIVRNEIYVPNGSKTSVILPDGSKVWLSNGTKFIYPPKFEGQNRTVELEGEGFFDVTHDKTHPFIVKLGQNRIKVLGTKFAIVAYSNDKLIKADLISGQIQFDINEKIQTGNSHSYLMTPSQSLVFDKSSGEVTKSKIADNFYDYWQNGIYQFKDESFEELAKKIERIYNVRVTFEDETLKRRLFSGSLSINDNIFTLMEVFGRATKEPFTYEHEGNHIHIKRKIN